MNQPSETQQGAGPDRWNERISAATSADARKELLSEAARWRAQNLSDLPAVRAATLAISRLHALMGDKDRAVGEARQLLSLCQTAPEASPEEFDQARGVLASLGESIPRLQASGGRRAPAGRTERGRREDRPREDRPRDDRRAARPDTAGRLRDPREARDPRERDDRRAGVMVDARKLAARSDWDGTIAMLDGVSSAPATVLRAYALLSRAVELGDDLKTSVEMVRADLARSASLPAARAADQPSASEEDEHLADLLGVPVPSKRAVRIRLIEEYAEKHAQDAGRLDELASVALRQHVAAYGITAPAPWLVGVTGRAFALGEAPQTRMAIDELRARGAVAVQAYDEWPFERLLRLTKRAEATGHSAGPMRRGVLARGESDDRKLWTLRISKDGTERMVAVAPHASAPYPDGKAEELADRLVGLCPRTLLLATGFGNAALRAAGAQRGLLVMEHDADDDAILAQIDSMGGNAVAAERGPSPPKKLADLLEAQAGEIDQEALTEVIRSFRRPDRAMRVVQRLDLDDARTAAVLRAVHTAAEADKPIPEATTLAVRVAARGPETRALLTEPGPVSARFSGPGMAEVIDLARVLLDAGWELHRVLRGPTRRECTSHPVLETLAPSMSGLWRLLIRKGDRKGEVWYLADLPPEGRAGVPQLLLEDWQRVVVVPLDPELLSWWRTLGSTEALGWTGSEGEALVGAVEAFVVRAEPREEEDGSA
jgi:hypothetical protein